MKTKKFSQAEIQNKRGHEIALKPVRQTLVWCRRREVLKERYVLINNHRLICLSTDNKAYGLGFMVHDRWKNNIAKVWKVNERISVIQFKINSKKDHIITVINVYVPHTGITKTNPQEAENFYDKLNEIIKEQRKTTSLLVIAGDFNSVVGKRTDDDNCLGKHSSGVRNRNGQNMINFCEFNSLLVTNTCFQHSQRHKTTWEQIRVSKGKNQVNKIRKTLDYIKCKNFRQIKFRTINFGENIFGQIFYISDKLIFGRIFDRPLSHSCQNRIRFMITETNHLYKVRSSLLSCPEVPSHVKFSNF